MSDWRDNASPDATRVDQKRYDRWKQTQTGTKLELYPPTPLSVKLTIGGGVLLFLFVVWGSC